MDTKDGKSVTVSEEVIATGVKFGGEDYDRVVLTEVHYHGADWGGQRGYWLHVSCELMRRSEGVTSRVFGVGRGSTKHLLASADRFNRRVMGQMVESAKTHPMLPAMREMVMEKREGVGA